MNGVTNKDDFFSIMMNMVWLGGPVVILVLRCLIITTLESQIFRLTVTLCPKKTGTIFLEYLLSQLFAVVPATAFVILWYQLWFCSRYDWEVEAGGPWVAFFWTLAKILLGYRYLVFDTILCQILCQLFWLYPRVLSDVVTRSSATLAC